LWFISLEGFFTVGMLWAAVAAIIGAFIPFHFEPLVTENNQVPVSIAIALYASIRSREYIIPVMRGRLTFPRILAVGFIGMLFAILG